ncbi:MAG: hypothetical protein ACRYGK_18705 [Janthinobacterium lividum]
MTNLNLSTEEHLQETAQETSGQHFVRRDFFSANIVELGISLQEDFGTRYAAKFLKDNWITLDVAARVLLRPDQRRAYH